MLRVAIVVAAMALGAPAGALASGGRATDPSARGAGQHQLALGGSGDVASADIKSGTPIPVAKLYDAAAARTPAQS
jgi:hypothetical protein